MPPVACADRRHDVGWLARLADPHNLIWSGMLKVRFDEFVAPALRVLEDLHAPLLGVALDPVVIVAGNLAQDIATDRIDMTIDPEKPWRSGAIQEGLNTAVP